jgi:hypothetical protein
MSSQTITVQIYRDGAICFIPVPFDPKAVFGRVRAPVKVTLNGYTYRSVTRRFDLPECFAQALFLIEGPDDGGYLHGASVAECERLLNLK